MTIRVLVAAVAMLALACGAQPVAVPGWPDAAVATEPDAAVAISCEERQCAIDGRCWAFEERNPANECRVCHPLRRPNAWTFVPVGTTCGGDMLGQCDARGECAY